MPNRQRLYDHFRIEVPLMRFGRPERRYFRVSAHIYNSLPEFRIPRRGNVPALTQSGARVSCILGLNASTGASWSARVRPRL